MLSISLYASDTIEIRQPISVYKLGKNESTSSLLIQNKFISIPYEGNRWGFLDYVNMKGVPWLLTIKKSTLNFCQSDDRNGKFNDICSQPRYKQRLVFDSCNINAILSNPVGEIVFIKSNVNTLNVNSSKDANVRLASNERLKFLVFMHNRSLSLDVQFNKNCDSLDFRSFNNSYKTFNLAAIDKEVGKRVYEFSKDTIHNLGFDGSDVEDTSVRYVWSGEFKNELIFSECYFNADVLTFWRLKNSRIVFNRCEFGPNIFLGDLVADRVEFRNCRKIDRQIQIRFRDKTTPAQIRIINTDVENLDIEWTDNVNLYFDSTDGNDARQYTYTKLLEKYKREGKVDSYRHVELQYLKSSQPKLIYFVSSLWWGHGYARERVYYWAILFVLIIAILNYWHWGKMQETYMLFDNEKFGWKRLSFGKGFTVLLYTVFIFFALTIRLENLKLTQKRYVLLFLFQYFLGLFTVLFILKAILKF